jgi:hypothetical protein
MANSHLTAVPGEGEQTPASAEVLDFARAPETGAERIRRLQEEARLLAHEQAEALAEALLDLAAQMAEVAGGGEAYPAGVREIASRIAEDLPQKAHQIQAVMARTGRH